MKWSFVADPPSPSGAQYSQQHPTSPSLAQTLGGCGYWSQPTGSPVPHPTPAAPMGGSSQRGKEAEVPPHATPPLCCGAPEHSMHPVESAAASRASHWSLRAKPTCYSAATMAFSLEKFIHSLDIRALPRVLQIQSGIYCQGEHRVLSGRFCKPVFDFGSPFGLECGGGRGKMLMKLSPSSFLPAEECFINGFGNVFAAVCIRSSHWQ